MRRINVLYLETGPGLGGSAKSLLILVKNLDLSSFRPVVLVHHKGPFIERIEELGIDVIQIDATEIDCLLISRLVKWAFGEQGRIYRNFRYYSDLLVNGVLASFKGRKIMHREAIDIVHLNNGLSENLLALLAGRLLGRPIVAHVRGTEPLLKLEKLICHWVSYYFMQNYKLIDMWKGPISRDRIVKVVNTIDRDILVGANPTEIKRNLGIPHESSVVGFAGRLVDGKGADILIRAAQAVVARDPSAHFVIIGAGPLQKDLETTVNDLNISGNIMFTGWRIDVGELMSCFDILVQPTTTFPESFGNTVIEAMALEKPVIASRVPGPDGIVIDGKTGFLIQPGSVDELVKHIDLLLNDPELARKMGLEGRRAVEETYNPTKQACVYEEIYAKLASVNSGATAS